MGWKKELDTKDPDVVKVGGKLASADGRMREMVPVPAKPASVASSEGGGGAALTVEEVDGTPSVDDVTQIVVPNNSLTDDGDGVVTVTPPHLLARITAVNGGDSYNCIEVDPATGNDRAGLTHSAVINRAVTAATLAVNDKAPLFREKNLFFFARRLKVTDPIVILASHDSWIDSSNPNNNYGSSTYLNIKNSPGRRWALFRIDPASIPAAFDPATDTVDLILFGSDRHSAYVYDAYTLIIPATFNESTVTYSNFGNPESLGGVPPYDEGELHYCIPASCIVSTIRLTYKGSNPTFNPAHTFAVSVAAGEPAGVEAAIMSSETSRPAKPYLRFQV